MAQMPPVPPDQRSPQPAPSGPAAQNAKEPPAGRQNLAEQGRQGNTKQNTTNQGLQQDR